MFSTPLGWQSCLQQLQQMENSEEQIALPVMEAVLGARVSIVISAGLTNLNTLLKQATVRRPVVVQHTDAARREASRLQEH